MCAGNAKESERERERWGATAAQWKFRSSKESEPGSHLAHMFDRLLHHCAVYNDSPRHMAQPKALSRSQTPFLSLHLKELWLGRLCTRLCGLVNVGFAGHARRLLCLPSVYLVLSFGSVVLTGESLSSGLV